MRNMARYVRTKLNFEGDTEVLKGITEELKADKEAISFEKIIPLEGDAPENKWGVVSDCEETDVVLYRKGTALEFSFDTVRKAPVPVYEKLADKYSELHMTVNYAYEEYGDDCGIYESMAGSSELVFSEPDDPFVFACEIWDVDPDEELNERAINFYEE